MRITVNTEFIFHIIFRPIRSVGKTPLLSFCQRVPSRPLVSRCCCNNRHQGQNNCAKGSQYMSIIHPARRSGNRAACNAVCSEFSQQTVSIPTANRSQFQRRNEEFLALSGALGAHTVSALNSLPGHAQEDIQFLGTFRVPDVLKHQRMALLHRKFVIACPRLHDNRYVPAFLAATQNRCAVATHISKICAGHA